ncbi:MAG: hypothetical protein AB1458_04290 [Bacteroidota bacterium]
MSTQVLKTIAAGVLAGALIFLAPFLLLKIILFFLVIKAIFHLLWGGWRKRYAAEGYYGCCGYYRENPDATTTEKQTPNP